MFNHKEDYSLYQDQNVSRAYFYILTSQNLPLNKLSGRDFTKIYFNFCILQPDKNSTNEERKHYLISKQISRIIQELQLMSFHQDRNQKKNTKKSILEVILHV